MNVRHILTAATALAAATILGFALTGCAAGTSDASTSNADGAAQLACTHFRNVMGDLSKGILTNDELVTKMQEVYNDASISTDPGIPDGSQALLAAATADDPTAFNAAITAFGTSCSLVGV
jgi:hypothetical protein